MSTAEQDKKQSKHGQKVGTVLSVSGSKTIRVCVERKVKHPLYGKFVKRKSNFAVHDEENQAKIGDIVEVEPCRPLSKTKSWRLSKIVRVSIGA